MKQTELTPQEAYARLASYCAQAERSPSDLRRRMQRLLRELDGIGGL